MFGGLKESDNAMKAFLVGSHLKSRVRERVEKAGEISTYLCISINKTAGLMVISGLLREITAAVWSFANFFGWIPKLPYLRHY